MNWFALTKVIPELVLSHDEQDVSERGVFRQLTLLQICLGSRDEDPTLEELGNFIDAELVDKIRLKLSYLRAEGICIAEFDFAIARAEVTTKVNKALRAFAATLRDIDSGELPLATEMYIRLARRYVLKGSKGTPSFNEGRRFARVLLSNFKNDIWEPDWDGSACIKNTVDCWLERRYRDELEMLINDSKESAVAWDVLQLICQKLAVEHAGGLAGGLADEPEECLPYELLVWNLMANHGHAKRPDPEPTPAHRPEKLSYKLRDNQIRLAVNSLVQVGMSRTTACVAAAYAVHLAPGTIQRICQEPYFTYADFALHAMKSILPNHPLFSGSDTNSVPSSSTRVGSRRSS